MGAGDITHLLRAWADGDEASRDALIALVYTDLKRRAAAHLRGEGKAVTLDPTALVHEAYLRLVDQRRADWQNRAHFFAISSQMMRRILVDRARARRAAKRPGQWARITLDEGTKVQEPAAIDVLALDAALAKLALVDPRKSQLVELRSFAGLSMVEAARTLGISDATAERDWRAARAWLLKEMA